MIVIEPKIVKGNWDGPLRELTDDESKTVTSRATNANGYVYYQGDEPETTLNLEDLKATIREQVDKETASNITAGFTFAGLTFSMGIEAQVNWTNFPMLPEAVFPLSVMSKNDEELMLTFANKNLFYGTALTHKNTCLQAGNAKKKAVNACQTERELNDLVASWNNAQFRRGRTVEPDAVIVEATVEQIKNVVAVEEAGKQNIWQRIVNYLKELFV